MTGKADVAGKDSRAVQSHVDDWRDREKKIALVAWAIVMIVATIAGFGIGYFSKNAF